MKVDDCINRLILVVGGEPSRVLQDKNFWHVLAGVGFRKEEKNGYEMDVPLFSNHLKSWDGKKMAM